jgi:hypothetical protein
MKKIVITLVLLTVIFSCEKENSDHELTNVNGYIHVQRCFCSPSAYRYLIRVYTETDTIYYNPINLSDAYKDYDYKIVFSADLLNDSTIVYINTETDALVESFRARNIRLSSISKNNE